MIQYMMTLIRAYLMGGAGEAIGHDACSDKVANSAIFIRTSEQGAGKLFNYFSMLAAHFRPISEQNRQKRACVRAECITMPKRAHPNMAPIMPLTVRRGGSGWAANFAKRDKSRQTRNGEKSDRRRTPRERLRAVTTYHATLARFQKAVACLQMGPISGIFLGD